MRRKTKLPLVVICIVLCLLAGGAAWFSLRVVAWVRDLPSRIQVDEAALADAYEQFVTEGIHQALNSPDPRAQQEMIETLAEMAAQDSTSSAWVREEFTAELEAASNSPDPDVADAATSLMAAVAESDVTPSR